MKEKLNLFFQSISRFFKRIGDWFGRVFRTISMKCKRIGKGAKAEDGQGNSELLEEIASLDTHGKGGGDKLGGRDESQGGENFSVLTSGEARQFGSIFKKRDKKRNFVLSVMGTTLKISFVAFLMVIAICLGSVAGVASAYLETTPSLDIQKIEDQSLTSYIYDANGELITAYTGIENRDWASIDEIPKLLQQAVIAVEDVRFYNHNGVDLKRLVGAFVNNLTSDSVHGGSTITQQLIKNQLLTSERSYKRKIQEAYLAMELEKEYSKDEILEAYLNTIPLGGSNYGVKAAAKDYFGKELDQLTLREMACLAGITQYPYAYDPRRAYYVTKDPTALNERIDTVLKRMYTAGYIDQDQYIEALNDELHVIEESEIHEIYDMPYFVEYVVDDVIDQFIKQRNLENTSENRAAIEDEIRTGGYRIYSTVDPEIQNTVQQTLEEFNYPKMADSQYNVQRIKNEDGSITEKQMPQAAAVVIDHHTGQIKAIVGGRTSPTEKKTQNMAVRSVMVGSSIKPVAVYAPAVDKGASDATIIPNIPVKIEGWSGKGYPSIPKNSYGPTTIREGVRRSLNVVAVRTLMDYVGFEESTNYLVSMGVDPSHINQDGPGLALGTSGISMLELTGAYATIANEGVYLEPLSFTKVLNSKGEVILDAEEIRDKRQVFKASTSYVVTEMLEEVVNSGTGSRARISGMTVAGKTGTNDDNRGLVFAGYTPYYTSCVWIGDEYDHSIQSSASASSYAAPLWKSYMEKIHEGLEDKAIIDKTPEELGLVRKTICSVSGMLATDTCRADSGGHKPVSGWYLPETAPTEYCTWHQTGTVCTLSGMEAGPYCPEELCKTSGVLALPSDSIYWQLSSSQLQSILPNAVKKYSSTDEEGNPQGACTIHTEQWAQTYDQITELTPSANTAISNAKNALSTYGSQMTQQQMDSINSLITDLDNYVQGVGLDTTKGQLQDPATLQQKIDALNSAVANVLDNLTPEEPEPTPSEEPEPTDPPEETGEGE